MFCNAIDGLLPCWIKQVEWRNLQSDYYNDSEKDFCFLLSSVSIGDNRLTASRLRADREMRLLSAQVTK